jgi:hypothetical protein
MIKQLTIQSLGFRLDRMTLLRQFSVRQDMEIIYDELESMKIVEFVCLMYSQTGSTKVKSLCCNIRPNLLFMTNTLGKLPAVEL